MVLTRAQSQQQQTLLPALTMGDEHDSASSQADKDWQEKLQTQLDAIQSHFQQSMETLTLQIQRLQAGKLSPASSDYASVDGQQPEPADPIPPEVESNDLKALYRLLQIGNTTNKKLDIKAPEAYTGQRNKKTIDQWLYKLNLYFENYQLSDKKKVTYAASLLKDTAFLWWQRRTMDGKTITTWEKFERALRKQFTPANAEFQARTRFRHLIQTGSLASYISQFTSLTLEIGDLPADEKLHAFIDGLHPMLRMEVHKYNPLTLSAAIHYAERIQDITGSNQNRNYSKDTKTSSTAPSRNNGKPYSGNGSFQQRQPTQFYDNKPRQSNHGSSSSNRPPYQERGNDTRRNTGRDDGCNSG